MIPKFIEKALLPHRPGVYIFKDSTGKILYVGKAIDLYHRVSSYFNGKYQYAKTASLVEHIASLQTIEVHSELEALILEANLIKKYLPLYNIRLTDDKEYLYIKITDEPYPKIITARKQDLQDAKDFFGPFPSGKTVRETLKKLRRIFPWCNGGSGRPCFYYHLNLCSGPCAGKINQKDYQKIIRYFIKFMEGKKEKVMEDLAEEMKEAVKALKFEKAEKLKRTISGVEYLTQINNVKSYLENPNFLNEQKQSALEELKKDLNLKNLPQRIECYDVSHLSGENVAGSLVVLTDGEIDKKWYRRFKIHLNHQINDVAQMKEIIERRVKHHEWPTPNLILIDGGRGQVKSAKVALDKAGWSVPVFGLAKRREWLYTPNVDIIKLAKSSLSLRLLQNIRNEAHRFAISYQLKLRKAV